jgi:GNAT superfamily N-acetyltransferase
MAVANRFTAGSIRRPLSRGIQMDSSVTIVEADLAIPEHGRDVVALTAAYACDAMGNGGPLPPEVLERLLSGLRKHPTSIIFLAYVDGQAVGIATCFLGFSTFAARPLINIHDLAVLPERRGEGIGRSLLEAVERKARELGCSKVTLETQEHNSLARSLYEGIGFTNTIEGNSAERLLFYAKRL